MQALRILKPTKTAGFVAENDNFSEISYLDVKALYDMAYDAKDQNNNALFSNYLKKAEKMDKAYRAQLIRNKAIRYGKAA